MLLQILVPQYKETDRVIKPLLDSIAIQQGINFNDVSVIIVNDGTDVFLSDRLLRSYPYSIKYYKEKHNGVSETRNIAFRHATAPYIMWCDADDMFASVIGLKIIFDTIVRQPFEILVPCFLQETFNPQTGAYMYTDKGKMDQGGLDGIFVHGKVYNRQFLLDNHLSWDKELIYNEDSFFNSLAMQCATKIQYCNLSYYLWKFNQNSVTRSEANWALKHYPDLVKSNRALLREFKARNMEKSLITYVGQLVCNVYFTVTNPPWDTAEAKPDLDYMLALMKEYLNDYGEYFEKIPQDIYDRIYTGQKNSKSNGKEVNISLQDWIKMIKEKY